MSLGGAIPAVDDMELVAGALFEEGVGKEIAFRELWLEDDGRLCEEVD